MSDFSWATANNASSLFDSMFYQVYVDTVHYPHISGQASTILQHFNFTPASDTNMFQNQTSLTDYATINANWK